MGDGIVIPIDGDDTKIRSKLARIKREAGDAGKSFGNASSQAARVGGAGGGMLARGLGGFNQGVGAGILGLGIAAAGAVGNTFFQRDAERVQAARDRETRQQGRDGMARTILERRDSLAAGGVGFLGAARRIIARGTPDDYIQRRLKRGGELGLSTGESLSSIDAADRYGISSSSIMAGMATGMIGESPDEVAQNIVRFNGLQNAVAAVNNMSPDAASDAIDRSQNGRRAGNVARAGAAMNPVAEAQLGALFEGRTADALTRQANDQLNPGAKLAAEAAQRVMDTVNQLRAAADSQSTLVAILKEMGRVIGMSEGSAARQLAVGAAVGAE